MENATKALLIAGSVLVVLLLIAVGLRIFNSTQGTVKSSETTMDATAIATFNTQFTGYGTNNITKSDALTLLNKIISNNSSNSKHQVGYSVAHTNSDAISNSSSTVSQLIIKLQQKQRYNIELSYDANGYINFISFKAST